MCIRDRSFTQYERIVLEPLLQHYGIKTPFIDLVDNVWVALWFALHQAKCKTINSHEYIYYYENDREYSYILLVATDAVTLCDGKSGVYAGTKTKLVDLRKALPSYFLRPHAQHAYMLRKTESYPEDYSDLIIGIAKIPTALGLKWLGQNDFLTVSSLFPAAYFDSGYAVLLKQYPEENPGTVLSLIHISLPAEHGALRHYDHTPRGQETGAGKGGVNHQQENETKGTVQTAHAAGGHFGPD